MDSGKVCFSWTRLPEPDLTCVLYVLYVSQQELGEDLQNGVGNQDTQMPHAGIFSPPGAPPPTLLNSSIIHDVLRPAVKTAHVQFFSPRIPACVSSPLLACKTNKETGFCPLCPNGVAGVCCCFLCACQTLLFLCERDLWDSHSVIYGLAVAGVLPGVQVLSVAVVWIYICTVTSLGIEKATACCSRQPQTPSRQLHPRAAMFQSCALGFNQLHQRCDSQWISLFHLAAMSTHGELI